MDELPATYIHQEQECSICLVSCIKPVKCKGPCQKPFCLKCAAQAKCSDDRCPHRCSKPFEVDTIKIPLRCPYRPEECVMSIQTENDLESHYLLCPYVSVQTRQAIDNKISFKCQKGHHLIFLSKQALVVLYGDKFWCDPGIKCASCQCTELCRAMCLTCSQKDKHEVYCCQCRTPPCSKEKCPLGHKFKHRIKPGKGRFCDFCDVPAGLMSNKVHGFCPCDFDLCDLCYSKLPATSDKTVARVKPQKLWPFSLVEEDSSDSDWKE